MLEKETDRLLQSFEQRTIGRGDTIALKEILAAEIPHPLKVFFRADVERLLEEERHRERTQTKFNYNHPEVKSLERQIDSVLVLNFTFTRIEYAEKLHDGVHLLINYLVRPQWTLLNVLFNNRPSVSVNEMVKLARYFGAYEYLRDIALRYAEEKMIQSFTQADLQKLLLRIDGEYIGRKDGHLFAHMLTPLYEFLAFPNFGCAKPIPTKALVKFFEDKRLPLLCQILERNHANGVLEISMELLERELEDARRADPNAFHPDEKLLAKPPPAESVGARPPEVRSAQKKEALESPRTPPAHPAPAQRTLERPDINELFDEEDRKRFVKKIFLKDERKFAASLASLNTLSTWKQASVFIDEIFIANDVDPYSAEAVRFTDLVYQHFFPTSQKP